MVTKGPVEKELDQMFYFDPNDSSNGEMERMEFLARTLDELKQNIQFLNLQVKELKCQQA